MMQDEKERLLSLLGTSSRWCQHAEARDRRGHAVHYSDPSAVAWDLTGAVCVLFGWTRALELFSQLERQLLGRKRAARRSFSLPIRDPRIGSMVAVQEFNDRTDTTYEAIMARLSELSAYPPASGAGRVGPALV